MMLLGYTGLSDVIIPYQSICSRDTEERQCIYI